MLAADALSAATPAAGLFGDPAALPAAAATAADDGRLAPGGRGPGPARSDDSPRPGPASQRAQSMQVRAAGRAASRSAAIGRPQVSQIP